MKSANGRTQARRGAFTLVEMMIVGIITVLIGIGLYTLLRSSYDSQYEIMNQNGSNTYARAVIDTLADKMRGLTALTAAAASDITYTDSGGSERYWLNTTDHTLRTSVGGSPAAGNIVVPDVTSLSFTYWSYSAGAWTSSSAPGVLANVGAIDIAATVTIGGSSRQMFSSVKLRSIRLNSAVGF